MRRREEEFESIFPVFYSYERRCKKVYIYIGKDYFIQEKMREPSYKHEKTNWPRKKGKEIRREEDHFAGRKGRDSFIYFLRFFY